MSYDNVNDLVLELCLHWKRNTYIVTVTKVCSKFLSLKTSVIELKL